MPLEVTCKRCGKVYETKPGDVISGKWRLCPQCRELPSTGAVPIEQPAAA